MRFEWDETKSEANLAKHKIDFDEACALWDDPNRIEFRLEHSGEQRYGTIARYAGALWFAVFVIRKDVIRLISVYRASNEGRRLYDKANANR